MKIIPSASSLIAGMHMKKISIIFLTLFWAEALLAQTPPFFGHVSELTIEWTAPTENEDGTTPLDDLAGFRLYYGQTSHASATDPTLGNGAPDPYDFVIGLPSALSVSKVVSNLRPGDWYFRVTAYDNVGNESKFNAVEASASLGISPVQGLFCAIDSGSGEPGVGTITNLSPLNYDPHNLTLNDRIYIDRSYVTTAVPPTLLNLNAIRTANDDKHNNAAVFVSFDIDNSGVLYIGYDSRATTVPSWLLADYINTGLVIGTNDIPFNVWSRNVPAGAVEIPGNKYGNPIGSDGNYLILIRFD